MELQHVVGSGLDGVRKSRLYTAGPVINWVEIAHARDKVSG